ncbi:hypothetical protein ACSHT2_07230 [Bradyrhizobium sp. PUT101]|uniref:hypothetical protein n=1 Tax=Bradyrhizobium sp. PUT101 TaxID=3447427 RepID=UPI003F832AD0
MRVIVGIALAVLPLNASLSRELQCPNTVPEAPMVAPLEKWTPQYMGLLDNVSMGRYFREGTVYQSHISCSRTVGAVKIVTQSACRIVEGDGKMQTIQTDKFSDITLCKIPLGAREACKIVCD